MAEILQPGNPEGPQNQSNSAPKSVEFNVGGNIEKSVVVIGDNNAIHYYSVVENNTEKHEPDFWALKHPYPMAKNFTGRIAERALLTYWLKEDSENRLFILRALGGFGKSALSWQWLTHDIDPKEYPKVFWWSFYEGDASFEHFIEETLKYLKLEVPQGHRPQVDELLKTMHSKKILLIVDGFERALRAYSSMNAAYQGDEPKIEDNQLDCVNINAEFFLKGACSLPGIQSKVLMTTRLTPRAVKPRGEFMLGCREEELTAMQKVDAVEFFRKQGIKGTHAEIESACAPYGYHPLSLKILMGLIINDRENPSDIIATGNIDITDDIIQNKYHILKVAYDILSLGQQKLLSNIACFRSPMNYHVLKFISSKPSWKRKNKSYLNEKLDGSLQILESYGLLHWDRQGNKYDLHPIVRRYAYERLTAPERIIAHSRLRDYFAMVDIPAKPQTLDDLAPAIELYHHIVRAGDLDKAIKLFHDCLSGPLYFQLCSYEMVSELIRVLFVDGEDKSPRLHVESGQAWAFSMLASVYSLSGRPHHSLLLFEQQNKLQEKIGNKKNLAAGLGNMAISQLRIGAINAAESNMRRSIVLGKEIENEFDEAVYHQNLGLLLIYCNVWDEAEQELDAAFNLFEKYERNAQAQSLIEAYRALSSLLMFRNPLESKTDHPELAIKFAQHALELVEQDSRTRYPHPRDFLHGHWLLGAGYRLTAHIQNAEHHLSEALSQCRAINLIELESDILLDLARLRYDQKNYEEAKFLADEALTITERCGYVLQGADVNLFLAQYALEQENDKVKAKQYAETALKLAYCDGPPYYYKVAYEEAERMLRDLA